MYQKWILIGLATALSSSCGMKRAQDLQEQRERLMASISIGDDIFMAKDRLIAQGYNIEYGPEYPTKSRRYLMMIVDYGIYPNGVDSFKYTVGIEGENEPISGIIRADPSGRIISIE